MIDLQKEVDLDIWHVTLITGFLITSLSLLCDSKVLTRRLRFRLERAQGETALIDRTGRTLKMEPLATVSSLERYLQKMVSNCQIIYPV